MTKTTNDETEPHYIVPAHEMPAWSKQLHGLAYVFGPESPVRHRLHDIARSIDYYASAKPRDPRPSEPLAPDRPVWMLDKHYTLWLGRVAVYQINGVFNVCIQTTTNRPAASFPTLAEAKAYGERLDADLRELGYGVETIGDTGP